MRLTNIGVMRQTGNHLYRYEIFFLLSSVSQAMLLDVTILTLESDYFKTAVKTVCRHDLMFELYHFVLECERLPKPLFPRSLRFLLFRLIIRKCD